jgi:hypothetical protein
MIKKRVPIVVGTLFYTCLKETKILAGKPVFMNLKIWRVQQNTS